jgi:hypothetical protein
MMRKTVLRGAFLLVALGGLVALPLAFAASDKGTQRSDCPGKVICPLTGEEVCKDQCPLAAGKPTATTREDCSGKVICPLTGEEVCKDQCPVGGGAAVMAKAAAESDDDLPACCRKAKK